MQDKENRPARRTMSSANHITEKAVEATVRLTASHPAQVVEAQRMTAALAQRHADPDEVAAHALVIVCAHVTDPDSEADWKKACRAAVKRAAAAVARAAATETPVAPEDFRDESRAALTHTAPDPAAGWDVRPLDLIAQTLIRTPATDAEQEALRVAVVRARQEQTDALTCREDGSRWRSRVRAAVAACRTIEPEVLADPYDDRTYRRQVNDWHHRATRTGQPLTPVDAPAAAALAEARAIALDACRRRDEARVRLALAHMDGTTGDDLRSAVSTHEHHATRAARTTARLAALEAQDAAARRRTGIAPQGLTDYDPNALSPHTPTRHPVEKKNRPAQVPAWQTRGGTARPDAGALVTVKTFDTGTPGIDLQHVTVTAPDGTRWVDRWTQHPLTSADVAALSTALAAPGTTAADALTLAERRMVNPDQGKPVATPSRRPSRVGNTGPTVATYAAVGMTR